MLVFKQRMSRELKNLNRLIFILALVGVLTASYVLQGWLRQTPLVCLTTGCEIVRQSPYSYPWGIPVPLFGLIGYGFLATLAFLRTTADKPLYLTLMLGMAIFGVGFVSWFTYVQSFVIGATCTWCLVSTVNMVIVFALIVKSYQIDRKHTKR